MNEVLAALAVRVLLRRVMTAVVDEWLRMADEARNASRAASGPQEGSRWS